MFHGDLCLRWTPSPHERMCVYLHVYHICRWWYVSVVQCKGSGLRNISKNTTRKYEIYRNTSTKCLKQVEEMYYKHLFDDTQKSAHNLWKHPGPIINLNQKKRGSNINKIIYNGEFIKDKWKICIAMNTYFCEETSRRNAGLWGAIPKFSSRTYR